MDEDAQHHLPYLAGHWVRLLAQSRSVLLPYGRVDNLSYWLGVLQQGHQYVLRRINKMARRTGADVYYRV